jgi:hypothetical protein
MDPKWHTPNVRRNATKNGDATSGHKFFSAAEMLALSENREWLDKATRAVAKCWKDRNINSNQSG